jgi:4-amino-4-deoxy-L-arabinose transferase-like glycosyltransferase
MSTAWQSTSGSRAGTWTSLRSSTSAREGTADTERPWWQPPALAAILLLASFLTIYRLDRQGYGNTYYAAAVKSMLLNWHNFFFASFDPAGFVSIDKPPLGYWLQTAIAKVFGFSGLILLLPQAIAAVLSVALLYLLVRRYFGVVAGLLAALVLALTPISVVTARDNLIDALLVLVLLLATWTTLRATENGSLGWLLLTAVIVGLGFNVTMLQAYLVVPAFALTYLVGTRLSWRTRIGHLLAAGLVLLVVSLSWAVAVDLTPASQRPYVGSSPSNSVLQLALGYNGLMRLLPSGWLPSDLTGMPAMSGQPAVSAGPMGALSGFGTLETLGPQRLFGEFLASQIAWLLPLAALGLVVAWWQELTHLPLSQRHLTLVLWGGWFLTAVAFFSVASPFSLMHRYYLTMLAPPLAALVGAGVVALWHDYLRPGWKGWLLPFAIAVTVAGQLWILAGYQEWWYRLGPSITATGLAAALSLSLFRLQQRSMQWKSALTITAIAAILAAPAVWSGYSVWHPPLSVLPSAGPEADDVGRSMAAMAAYLTRSGGSMSQMMGLFAGKADPRMMQFLTANQGQTRYLVAGTNALSVAPIILSTDAPVADLGGFLGIDPVVSTDRLADLVSSGGVRFILAPVDRGESADESASPATQAKRGAGGFGALFDNERVRWINEHCTLVPVDQWRTDAGDGSPGAGLRESLFDCQNAAA